MKKLLVLTSAIALGFTACDKKEANPVPTSNKQSNVNLRTIATGAPATRTWSSLADDCIAGGSDCLDDVDCVAEAPSEGLWEFMLRYWRENGFGPADGFLGVYSETLENNNLGEGLTAVLGADNCNAILSGQKLLKIRVTRNKPNTIYLGLYEASNPDKLTLMVPLTNKSK